MAVKFTNEQQKAIDTLDRSVLVAAAAGSGKTAVLVERIIKIILEGKADVDEMLVVTFTKAAAAEMRLKLAKAIKDKIRKDPASRDTLKPQLDKLYKAYISTFDSFAVRVIREFFYEIDMEPNFKACDEVQSTLLQKEAVDELFEDAFADDGLIEGGSFRAFLRLYSSDRGEDRFKEDMLAAYSKLRTMPDYFVWAYDKAEALNITMEELPGSELSRAMLFDAKETLGEAVRSVAKIRQLFEEAGLAQMFESKLASESAYITRLYEMTESGEINEAFFDAMKNIEFDRLVAKKDEKAAYEGIREKVKALRDNYKKIIPDWTLRYLKPDAEKRFAELRTSYEYTVYYLNLLKKFEDYYNELKRDKSYLDFADMEHYAVKILQNKDAAEALRKRFKFIFIDEYQDTNNIQEYLIGCFAREDNVFKVGDVKQSIYRFRQAEPAIFERTYREYSEGANENAEAIDLNMNFRSNDRTLRYINAVFEEIMEGYDSRAKLYTGLSNGPGYRDNYDFIPEVHILTPEWEPDEEPDVVEEDDAETAANEEIVSLDKEEAEAEYIAGLVEKIIGTEFCDTKQGVVRKAEAGDVAILEHSVKVRGDLITRALHRRNILSHIEEEDDYFDTVEIGIALSLFSCIDNMKRDVPLISTLHSEIFAWTPEELARIRSEYDGSKRDPYWMALTWYAENGPDAELRDKANVVIGRLREWRDMSMMMPIEDFIWKVLVDSGYYMFAGAMYGGGRRQANLRALVDKARKYSEDTIASLSSFLDFLSIMKSKGVKNGQAGMVSKEDNVVRITTIHKSKGLEYPFVIVGGLGHRFMMDRNELKLSFDSELGVAMPYVSPDRKYWRSTIMQRAINAKGNAESYKEELRVLYVAMTRARNKLYMVGTVDDMERYELKAGRPGNYLEVMKDSIRTPFNEYHIVPMAKLDSEKNRVRVGDILATRPEVMSPETLKIYEELDRRLNYQYPDEEMLEAAAKYSVSAIRREVLRAEEEYVEAEEELVHLWRRSNDRKRASAADIGIAYHRIMEFLDFSKDPDDEMIAEAAAYLVDSGAIDEDVYKALDLSCISGFFASDVGRRAVAAAGAGSLRKEKAFTLQTEHQGRNVLVQGIIDCCWIEDGKVILVDYKSSFIDPRRDHDQEIERIRHEYKPQIELYSEAVEKGLGMPVSEAYLYLFMTGEAISL
ncbi:MAG: UvrD-helicase domain-containing protein [Mogibacterium sp.]|nr:UvrD-helicase domain-containing protein [Mogibacterium sp.]